MCAALLMSTCSTFSKVLRATNDPTIKKVMAVAPLPADVAHKIRLYQKYSSKYLKFTDGGNLDDGDILDVLRDSGVIAGAPRTSGRSAKAGKVSRVPPPVQNYSGGYRWPTDAGIVSSEYGPRWGRMHKGIDIAADTGEPVKASAAGVVIYSGSGMRGYGNVIIVRHDEKMTTLYAHNSKLISRVDDHVTAGQTISLLGSSGQSSGPHVHFEIRDGEKHLNPRDKLGKPNF